MLRECMRCSLSAMDDLEAGTSIAPVSVSPGTARVWENLAGEPLLNDLCVSPLGVEGLELVSSYDGMLKGDG
jgi:hypothetical protein